MAFQRRRQFFQRFDDRQSSVTYDLFQLSSMDAAAANSDPSLRGTLLNIKLSTFYMFRTPLPGTPPSDWTSRQLFLYQLLERGGLLQLYMNVGPYSRIMYLPYIVKSDTPESPSPLGCENFADRAQCTFSLPMDRILSGSSQVGNWVVRVDRFIPFSESVKEPILFEELAFTFSLFTTWDVTIGAYAQEFIVER